MGSSDRWNRIFIVGVLAWIVVCAPIQSHQLTNYLPARWSDFYPIYRAAQVSVHGGNPYSESVTRSIQVWFYGHPLSASHPSGDREAFVYPGYAAVLFLPLTAIPWPVLSLLLTALWPMMIAFSAWAWIDMCAPDLGNRASIIALVLMATSWPALWVCHTTQPTVPAFALATAACFLLRARRDVLAGMLLTASMFKPQLIVLILPWLLIWAMVQRRWRFVSSFAISAILLFAASLIVLPHWISQWRASLSIYVDDGKASLFALLFSRYAIPAEIVALLLIAYIIRGSIHVRADSHGFVQAAALLLAFQLCIIPGGSFWFGYNQILLFPSALLVITSHPNGGFHEFSSAAASILIELSILAAPVCATIYVFVGYRLALTFLPAQDTILPLVLSVAMIGLYYEADMKAKPKVAAITDSFASTTSTALPSARSPGKFQCRCN